MKINSKKILIFCISVIIITGVVLLVVYLPKKSSNDKRYLAVFKDNQDFKEIQSILNQKNIKIIIYHDNIGVEILISEDVANNIRHLFKTLTYEKIESLDDYNQKQIDIINIWNESFTKAVQLDIQGPGIWHPPFATILPEEFALFMLNNNIVNKSEYDYILKDKDPRMVKTSLYSSSNKVNALYQNKLNLNRNEYEKIKQSLPILLESVPTNLWDKIINKFNSIDLFQTKMFLAVLNGIGTCKTMNGKIAVGVIVVNSSLNDGPVFSQSEQTALLSGLNKAHRTLTLAHPSKNISWYVNTQNVKINIKNGPVIPYGSKVSFYTYDNYWRYYAIKQINFNGKTYFTIGSYLIDLKKYYSCDYSICYFLTPYETAYPAYAIYSEGVVTLSSNKNYIGWGLDNAWKVLTHETCHLFGAADEYGSTIGTSCTSCTSLHGCNNIQNKNCQYCNSKAVSCVMINNDPNYFCEYTKGQIGWITGV